jgi:hypothetical protein
VFRQELCLKITAYDQDKFSGATELCEANLALRDLKNITTATEAIAVSCSLARANRVSCAVHCYVLQQGVCGATGVCSLPPAGGTLHCYVCYRRLCEVPLLSVHCVQQVEPCTAMCATEGCVKCHCCLFIASCRWNRALLCVLQKAV